MRELTGLGLKEAKDVVEAAPKAILEKVNKETAEKAKAKLEAEGAKVTLGVGPLPHVPPASRPGPAEAGGTPPFPAPSRPPGMRPKEPTRSGRS